MVFTNELVIDIFSFIQQVFTEYILNAALESGILIDQWISLTS